MEKKEKSAVKMNLTLPSDFFEVIQENARSNYMKATTWTKQFLMKNLLTNNERKNSSNENERNM